MRDFENVVGMRKKRKRPLLSPRLFIWEDIIKVGYKERMGKEPLETLGFGRRIILKRFLKKRKKYEDLDRTDLAEYREKWLAVVNIQINLQSSTK